jgi:ferredoxin
VTPVLSILHALVANRSARDIRWIYGARDGAHHPFSKEVRRLVALLPQAAAHVSYSRPNAGDRPGLDYNQRGHVTRHLLEELKVPRQAEFYLCGPAGFLSDLHSGLLQYGVAAEHIHAEVFGPGESGTPGLIDVHDRPPHSLEATGGGPSISFVRSGVTAGWNDSYRSVLEVAEASDVPVQWSCRTGVCHRCETGLVAGRVKYDPEPLEPPAEGHLLTCCAQPTSDVVIDL